MFQSKNHLISPGCPRSSIALAVQNRDLKHQSFHFVCLLYFRWSMGCIFSSPDLMAVGSPLCSACWVDCGRYTVAHSVNRPLPPCSTFHRGIHTHMYAHTHTHTHTCTHTHTRTHTHTHIHMRLCQHSTSNAVHGWLTSLGIQYSQSRLKKSCKK